MLNIIYGPFHRALRRLHRTVISGEYAVALAAASSRSPETCLMFRNLSALPGFNATLLGGLLGLVLCAPGVLRAQGADSPSPAVDLARRASPPAPTPEPP